MYALAEEGEEIFKEEVPEPANMTELILDVIDYITDVNISSKEASILLKDADYQIDTVKKAYDLSRSQPEIKNFMGWMRQCIRDDYQPSIEVMNGSQEAARQVKELQKDIEANKTSLSEKVWEKTKQKDNYPQFLQYLDSQGISEDIIDTIYSPEECLNLYVDWVKNN